jgi:hypothetical protein
MEMRMTRHFVRHYFEMVAAMMLGMVVLGAPGEIGLHAIGSSSSELRTDAPALLLLGMASTMTVPMVGWMRFRGHGWPASAEMAAAMVVPTLAAIALLGAGLVTGMGPLMSIEHVAMLLAMLAAMLLRREEYSHTHADSAQHEVAA